MNFYLPLMPALRKPAVTHSAVLSFDRPRAANVKVKQNRSRGGDDRPRNSLRGTVTRQNCQRSALLNRSGKHTEGQAGLQPLKNRLPKRKAAKELDLSRGA